MRKNPMKQDGGGIESRVPKEVAPVRRLPPSHAHAHGVGHIIDAVAFTGSLAVFGRVDEVSYDNTWFHPDINE